MRTHHLLAFFLVAAVLRSGSEAQLVGKSAPTQPVPSGKLIVIGFVGGYVRADNFAHRGVREAKELEQHYPASVQTAVFTNHDAPNALQTLLQLLDTDGDGQLSTKEKEGARIVIYGTSWGASETVTLARRLNELGIPVLLTVQIDSVAKRHEDDRDIPPNVQQAVNFYQTQGLLHGRRAIVATDPNRTTIVGNFEQSYRDHQIACPGYPWLPRTFTKPHIEIENDPDVWTRVEALIRAQLR